MERADGVLQSIGGATISTLQKELIESGLDELAARDTVKALGSSEHTVAIFDAAGELLAERPSGWHNQVALPDLRTVKAENLDERIPVVNASEELGRLAATFNELLSRLSGLRHTQPETA